MRRLKLLNGDKLDKLIKQAKSNNIPIFDEEQHFKKEILGKWKAVFGFIRIK